MVLIGDTLWDIADKYRGFRPLAGIMVLIDGEQIANVFLYHKVSVPLRGLWFLSESYLANILDGEKVFPSPCGDYGSYHPERGISALRRVD